MTTTLLPPLPPGYTPAAPAACPDRPTTGRPDGPPLSGVLTIVTTPTGADVTVHRWDYRRPTPHGGFTIHGYAWRCTSCRALSRGYEPCEFAAALGDGRDHACEETTR